MVPGARARAAGSPERDWYVWSDTDDRYEDARIIFTDTETSNWTWDQVAGAVLLAPLLLPPARPQLRQPRGPRGDARRAALLARPRPRRLPPRRRALPLRARGHQLREPRRRPTSSSSKVRATVDAEYPDRVLLAEANQWPEDVVEYFGDGDECHMAFHFPVMPRMFMALAPRGRRRRSSRSSSARRRSRDNCQWGLFLRNHDELTLEMVTDEERDYMYAEYAKDPRMKINVGIRRRLAPLLDNGRDEIELMHAILFSLPGLAGPLLRRRDRDGRQRLPRRPRRRAHADAVDGRPQRRLLARRLRPALRAAADGPGLRLPGRQRRGAAAHADVAAALAAALHRAAQGAPGLRPGHLRAARARATRGSSPTCAATRTTSLLCVHNLARSAQAVELDLSSLRGPLARWRCSGARASRASASCPTC